MIEFGDIFTRVIYVSVWVVFFVAPMLFCGGAGLMISPLTNRLLGIKTKNADMYFYLCATFALVFLLTLVSVHDLFKGTEGDPTYLFNGTHNVVLYTILVVYSFIIATILFQKHASNRNIYTTTQWRFHTDQ
ncbi:MAG: hypothetical protein HQL05_07645 [Nitrospirae bacterium]|uniref:hypothetical protein n=1 Tax=Candidatus Magnetobacterium casense TaxID=1455061 RepID=UPI00058B70FE|nr:hypothetical protein [Candidatus Magnetobacterium casensis]MBF0337692.1 hypothetical protein [Nitrospirota bacterium]